MSKKKFFKNPLPQTLRQLNIQIRFLELSTIPSNISFLTSLLKSPTRLRYPTGMFFCLLTLDILVNPISISQAIRLTFGPY